MLFKLTTQEKVALSVLAGLFALGLIGWWVL
jgi:hypothetical protein